MLNPKTLRLSLLIAIAVAACDDHDGPAYPASPSDFTVAASMESARGDSEALTVLTRNVYLGADIGPIFGVDFGNPLAVVAASAAIWGEVQATRFEERAEALADEIAEERPHLVGLQEVARFITLDGAFNARGALDFLAVLEAELIDRGLSYTTVKVQAYTHVTLPVALDLNTFMVSEYVDFTDRDVVLVRSDVSITDVSSANYAAEFTLVPGVTLKRGWIRVDAEYRGDTYHFVNTHFEGQSLAPVQAGQLQELLGGVLVGLDGVTILAGDLNSDAEGAMGDPSWTPSYGLLLAQGFVDTWAQSNPGRDRSGFTCCNDPDLLNGVSSLDQRIDFILVRDDRGPQDGRLEGSVHSDVVGEELADLTSGGLWPSDHAGLTAELRLAPGIVAQDR